ncbi:hypothetical protein IIC65_01415 [Candidatus Sumerlaeota bacterium]|nr:hypothetical protein [Candidatus Sumerlaeota bacterium]
MTADVSQNRVEHPIRPRGLDWTFLRRTAAATVATLLLVALIGSIYSIAWGARYLAFSIWSLVFFSLTALILKSMMFDQNRVRGMLFVGLKVLWVMALISIPFVWPIEGADVRSHGIAMVAGITTPLGLVVLRALGFLMEPRRKGLSLAPRGAAPSTAKSNDSNDANADLRTHP